MPIGLRPPWWRFFARRRWDREMRRRYELSYEGYIASLARFGENE
jgi:hypothetical protein